MRYLIIALMTILLLAILSAMPLKLSIEKENIVINGPNYLVLRVGNVKIGVLPWEIVKVKANTSVEAKV